MSQNIRHIITINNIKGGVGKTTLTVNLAYTLAKLHNKKILIVDLDPQMNATSFFYTDEQIDELLSNNKKVINCIFNRMSDEPNNFQIVNKYSTNLHIIPSNFKLVISASDQDKLALKHFLNSPEIKNENYDFIFLDTPPTVSDYSRAALFASDGYLIPTICSHLSLIGLQKLMESIDDMGEVIGRLSNIQLYGIILTKVPKLKRAIKYDRTMKFLKKNNYEKYLFEAQIREENAADSILFDIDPKKRFFLENGNRNITTDEAKHLHEDIIKITDEFLQKVNSIVQGNR